MIELIITQQGGTAEKWYNLSSYRTQGVTPEPLLYTVSTDFPGGVKITDAATMTERQLDSAGQLVLPEGYYRIVADAAGVTETGDWAVTYTQHDSGMVLRIPVSIAASLYCAFFDFPNVQSASKKQVGYPASQVVADLSFTYPPDYTAQLTWPTTPTIWPNAVLMSTDGGQTWSHLTATTWTGGGAQPLLLKPFGVYASSLITLTLSDGNDTYRGTVNFMPRDRGTAWGGRGKVLYFFEDTTLADFSTVWQYSSRYNLGVRFTDGTPSVDIYLTEQLTDALIWQYCNNGNGVIPAGTMLRIFSGGCDLVYGQWHGMVFYDVR